MGWIAFAAWCGTWMDGAVPFRDTPAHHWFYEGRMKAKRLGLLAGYSNDRLAMAYHAPAPTYRSEAEAISFVFNEYGELTKEVLRERDSIANGRASSEAKEGYTEDLRLFPEYRELLPFFRRAEWFFEGRSGFWPMFTVSQLARLSDRVTDFPDVPKGHWASEAVRELRTLGLIEGYPGGRFGSDHVVLP